jgi:circadian clock protein KaiC
MLSERVSTGNPEVDKLLEGGFPRGSVILVAGSPGAGKTLFAATFVYRGALDYGEPGVYACFAESRERFLQYMRKFGMDFEPLIRKGRVAVLDLSLATEVDVQSALNQILEAVTTLNAKRLVIDSITGIFAGLKSELEKRHVLRLIYRLVQRTGCTTIVISDVPWGSSRIGDGIEEFIADGIILMESQYNSGTLERRIRVLKMRGTEHTLKTHKYRIDREKGLTDITAE